jgi:signal transduction histidine kinase
MLKMSALKLNETIENLNEIITIQTDATKRMTKVNLRQEVEATCNGINSMISETNTMIINNISEDIIINVVPSYMESILLNLLSNGIKYRSLQRQSIIKISAQKKEQYLILSIEDNGIGIDLNKNGSKLFGMYKTFHNNKDAKGIGLFITKNQIEAMNGKIEVESKLDIGSTFKIYLYEKTG